MYHFPIPSVNSYTTVFFLNAVAFFLNAVIFFLNAVIFKKKMVCNPRTITKILDEMAGNSIYFILVVLNANLLISERFQIKDFSVNRIGNTFVNK